MRDPRGSVFSEDDKDRNTTRYLSYGDLDNLHETYRAEINKMLQACQIAPVYLGIDVGKGESGQARQEELHGMQRRSMTYRQPLQLQLPNVLSAAYGNEMTGLEVFWPRDPLVTEAQQTNILSQQLEDGVIDIDEYRASLGKPPFTPEQMASREAEKAAERDMMMARMSNGPDDGEAPENGPEEA